MATTQGQVDKAMEELKFVKRNKDGSVNNTSLWAVAKRHKAYPNFADFEDTPFSAKILVAIKSAT